MSTPGENPRDAIDLEGFVRSTLLSIVRGVIAAQRDAEEVEGAHLWGTNAIEPWISNEGGLRHATHVDSVISVHDVEFDVAVSATTERKANAGLRVWILRAGGDLGSENAVAQRVRFKVPVAFPPRAKRDRGTSAPR